MPGKYLDLDYYNLFSQLLKVKCHNSIWAYGLTCEMIFFDFYFNRLRSVIYIQFFFEAFALSSLSNSSSKIFSLSRSINRVNRMLRNRRASPTFSTGPQLTSWTTSISQSTFGSSAPTKDRMYPNSSSSLESSSEWSFSVYKTTYIGQNSLFLRIWYQFCQCHLQFIPYPSLLAKMLNISKTMWHFHLYLYPVLCNSCFSSHKQNNNWICLLRIFKQTYKCKQVHRYNYFTKFIISLWNWTPKLAPIAIDNNTKGRRFFKANLKQNNYFSFCITHFTIGPLNSLNS